MRTLFTVFIFTIVIFVACKDDDPEPVTAEFTVDFNDITTGQTIQFQDLSQGKPFQWNWSFEGGTPSSSSEQNPTVIYSEPGSYAVSLQVSNDASSDVNEKIGFINVSEIVNPECAECLQNPIYSVDTSRNVVYGINSTSHVMNVYEPSPKSSKTWPTLVFVGGGNYGSANLDQLDRFCRLISSYGMVVAAINYRPTSNVHSDPKWVFQGMSYVDHDLSAAVRFFRRYAEEYNVDTEKIFTGGYSSGATGAIVNGYYTLNDIFPEVEYLYDEGKEGVQGNPGYSNSSLAVIALSGEMMVGLDYMDVDDPHFFGVCALNDAEVTCDFDFTDNGGFTKYGAKAIDAHARSIGLISDYYYFPGSVHNLGINEPEKYIDKLISFMRRVIYDQEINAPS